MSKFYEWTKISEAKHATGNNIHFNNVKNGHVMLLSMCTWTNFRH